MKFFLHETRVLKTRDLRGIFALTRRVFWTRVLIGSRVSKTRDAIFLYCFKRCLTNYIQSFCTTILHITSRIFFFFLKLRKNDWVLYVCFVSKKIILFEFSMTIKKFLARKNNKQIANLIVTHPLIVKNNFWGRTTRNLFIHDH